MLKSTKKVLFIISSLLFLFVIFIMALYLYILPTALQNNKIISSVENIVNKTLNAELVIGKPLLKTALKPEIRFKIDRLFIQRNNNKLIELEDFDIQISFNKIFKKEIKLDELKTKTLFVDCEKLLELFPQNQTQNQKQIDWKIDLFTAKVKIDNSKITYKQTNNSKIELFLKDLIVCKKDDFQNLSFDLNAQIKKNNQIFANIQSESIDEIKLYKDKIKVDKLNLLINSSKTVIASEIDFDKVFINAFSQRFLLEDIFKLVNSDFLIPNGSLLLAPLVNPNGNVAFDINLNNFDLSGYVDINNTKANLKDVSNIPLNIQDGKVLISKNKIDFNNLIGYYGKSKANKINIQGDIKDYYKTFDSNITIESVITNEFFKDYLSKLINNTTLFVSEPSRTKIIYKSKNNIMDIIWFAQISKGVNFGISNEKSVLSDYDRAVLGEFRIQNDKINLKNLNYYIASDIVRGVKLQPILVLNALMDFTGKLDKIGVAFGREMPCEFLNVFAGQKLFKKGTIKGKMELVFKNNIPSLIADMIIKDTVIPSQRLLVKEASIKASDNWINLYARGGFKRAKYIFDGKIKNELKAPYIIEKLSLNLDNVDVEKFLVTMNNQTNQIHDEEISEEEIENDDYMFDTNLVRIKDCDFSLQQGKYKELNFGNIKAKLTLDEKGKLNIKSNRFDIAKGISSLKIDSD